MRKIIIVLMLGVLFGGGFSSSVFAGEVKGESLRRVADVVTGLPSLMTVEGEPWQRVTIVAEVSTESTPIKHHDIPFSMIREILKDGADGKTFVVDSFFGVFTEFSESSRVERAGKNSLFELPAIAGDIPPTVRKKPGRIKYGNTTSGRPPMQLLDQLRTGRNPQTGATIQISPKKVVKFKAGADLASKVN